MNNVLFFLTPKAMCSFLYDDYTVRQALEKMEAAHFSALPILNRRGEYRGTLTEGDILWAMKNMCYMDMRQAEAHRIMEISRRRDHLPVRVTTSMQDLVDYDEILGEWWEEDGIRVHLTIDREQEGWDGHVGFVPNYVKELNPSTDSTVLVCGPPVMIKFTLAGLKELGFEETQVYTTMELRMKCGVGKCGRCNIGSKYVCKDGPVFRCDELEELPSEY